MSHRKEPPTRAWTPQHSSRAPQSWHTAEYLMDSNTACPIPTSNTARLNDKLRGNRDSERADAHALYRPFR